MRILQIVILSFVFGSDVAIFIWDWRLSKKVFYGQISSIYKQLGISILIGTSVSLLFISTALLARILDITYVWTINGAIGVIIIALALGVLGMIGSIWSFFIAGKFRSHLFTKYIKK